MYWGLRPGGAFSNQVGTRLYSGRNLNSDRIVSMKKLIGNKSEDKSPTVPIWSVGPGDYGALSKEKIA